MNRNAERTTNFPIGQRHASTITVWEFKRQLGLRGESGGKNATNGTGEGSRFEVFGTSNPELLVAPFSPIPPASLGYPAGSGPVVPDLWTMEFPMRTIVFPQHARYLFRYTSHHAIALLATDTVPCPHDATCPGDASLHAGPSDQVRPAFLSRSRADVRPLPGAERSGLRSGPDRLFDRAEDPRHLLHVRKMDDETRSTSTGPPPGPVL